MPSQSFLTSRKIGEKAQDIIAHKLENKGFSVDVVKSGYFTAYDLFAHKEGMQFTAEVKRDCLTKDTGNVCVDVNALAHSKASILFYMIDQDKIPDKFFIGDLQKTLSYAKNFPVKKNVGEYLEPAALIPLDTFRVLPFVKPF